MRFIFQVLRVPGRSNSSASQYALRVAGAAHIDSPSAQKFLCNRGDPLRLESEFSLQ